MKIFINFLFVFHVAVVSAQITIKGRVINEAGDPMPGATIGIKTYPYQQSFKAKTCADKNGFYVLKEVMSSDSINCTYTGYFESSVAIGYNEKVSFILKENEPSIFVAISKKVSLVVKQRDSTKEEKKQNVRFKRLVAGKILAVEEDKIFTKVEFEAEFDGKYDNGSRKSLKRYFEQNIRLPDSLSTYYFDDPKTGYVKLKYTIDQNGKVKDIFILESFNTQAEQAVLLALNNMPAWIPARQNGYTIDSKHALSVYFNLEVRRSKY